MSVHCAAVVRGFALLAVALFLLDNARFAVCQHGQGEVEHEHEAVGAHRGHGTASQREKYGDDGHVHGHEGDAPAQAHDAGHHHDGDHADEHDAQEHGHEEDEHDAHGHGRGSHGQAAQGHAHGQEHKVAGDHTHHSGQAHDHDDHRVREHQGYELDWTRAYASAIGMSVISFVGVVFLGISGNTVVGGAVEYICLAFAGAVLVADALLHLLPHSLEGADHESMALTGMAAVAGCFSLLILQELCEWHRHVHHHDIQAYGVANLAVEMLHNYVDGITIGLSWVASQQAGLGSTLAVAVHELPQELGDFMVLRAAGFPVARLLAWNFAASLTCVAGVATAHFVGQEATHAVKRYLTAFTAGSFLTLGLNMVIPQALTSIQERHKGAAATRAKLFCLLIAGFAVWTLVRIGDLEADHDHGHGHDNGHDHGHHGGVRHHEF